MQTILIDGSLYATAKDLHLALKRLLSLPDYYGLNADALSDCLSERAACPGLWFSCEGPEDVARALRLIARVFADQGGEVKEIP